ncbi:MAG: hypothetical protein RL660_449 [Bacteroidota bacterium]|jgi:hypothetical protein
MARNKKYNTLPQKATLGANKANFSGTSSLAATSKAASEIINRIITSYTGRIRQDIKTWRAALQMAESEENPQRYMLYTVYKDVELDDQVVTVTGNLEASIKSEAWNIVDDKGKVNAEVTKLLRRPWFYDFITYVIRSTYQGFVLLQLDGVIRNEQGQVEITGFNEVPRNNVNPELGIVAINVGDDKGIDYNDKSFAKAIIQIGKRGSLGRLNPCAPKAIYKKNVEAAWAEFCEIFGMPVRIGKVASRNPKDMDQMEDFLRNMGSAAYAVIGGDDTIELKESSRGDAYKVYDEMIARQDRAISKIFLGQTMTTENGSSRSQAEVHERVADARMQEIKMLVDFVVNIKLMPLLLHYGYPVKGLSFAWEASTNITSTDIEMDTFLVNNFEFTDLEYFTNKYRVPIKAVRAKQEQADQQAGTKTKPTKLSQTQALNHIVDVLYNQAHEH